jgi:hypothetical protein
VANFSNLSGTTVDTFKIGKGGITLHQGGSPPGTAENGDFWFDTSGQLHTRISGSWELITFDNISITGNTIASTDTNGNISLTPDGTGNVVLGNFEFDADQTVDATVDQFVLAYDDNSGEIRLQDSGVISGALTSRWVFKNITTAGDPGSGNFRLNNAVMSLATELYISEDTDNNVNVSNIINILADGDVIYIQNQKDPTEAVLYSINGSVTDNTTYFTIPLTYIDSSTEPSFSNNRTCGFIFTTGVTSSGLQAVVDDPTPQLGGNLDAQNNDITNVDAFEAASALLGNAPDNLRAFNIRGTGLDGRLSLQGGSGDNPGLEMTTTSNSTRVLIRLAEVGTNGTSLQTFVDEDGGGISKALEIDADSAIYIHPTGAGTTATKDTGIRNSSGTMQFKNSAGSWTNIGSGSGSVTSVAVAGTDGLEVDSGSPITGAGTITLGVDAATLRTHINVEDGATSDQNLFETVSVTDTDSGYTWSNTGSITAGTTTDTLTIVSGSGIDIDVDSTSGAVRIESTLSGGTVTSVSAGNGMDFTAITGSGDVVLGTPSSITSSSTNSVTATSHSHSLDNGAVTLAKFQDIATDSFLGRSSAGTGNVEVLSATQAKSILAITAADISDVETSTSDRARANHTGTQLMSTISDAGDLATLNTVGTTEIDDDSVTFTKVENIAQDVVLGRVSAGVGNTEELTATQVRTLINVADGANNYTHPNHTGQVTSTGDGSTIVSSTAITDQVLISGLANNDQFLVYDDGFGILYKTNMGQVSQYCEDNINHDNLPGFVLNEHINWTSTTENLSTSGTITVGNINLDGNTISSTDTNGNLNIIPDGTGEVILGTASASSTLEAPPDADAFIIAGEATTGNDGSDLYLRGGSGAGGTGIDGNAIIDVGNLGIGTSAPASALDIEVNDASDTNVMRLANIGSAGIRMEFYDSAGTDNGQWRLQAFAGNSEMFEITKQGTGEIELGLTSGGNLEWREERVPVCFGSLAGAPTAQGIGDTYYNSGSAAFFIWNGSSWLQIT